jgi:hypothetical protein
MKAYLFRDAPLGMFWYNGIVFTKINDNQAVMITSGKLKDFSPEETIYKWE